LSAVLKTIEREPEALPISQLFVDRAVADRPEVDLVCGRIGLPPILVDGPDPVYRVVNADPDPIRKGKEILFLTRNRGAFVRDCPGTRNYDCCGYRILHVGTYCTMDCAYCILQSYFHPPLMQYFVNHHEMMPELDNLFAEERISRVGTGEFTDSLIWQRWTDLAQRLVSRFAEQDRAVLELKTKTVDVADLKGLDHRRKTILSWSVNTHRVIQSQERGTTSLNARLRAAGKCQSWGYPVAFHLDPMVIYKGCEEAYRQVVEGIFEAVDADNIVWISLGTFRFIPTLKEIIAQRFPASKIPYGEFITGLDGKMRYFKPLRIALYRAVAARIRALAPQVPVYFCMEDSEVWEESLGFFPERSDGIAHMLDRSVVDRCGLNGALLKS
jgi:DNA repair photolyase